MPFLTIPIGPDGALIDLHVALSTPRIDALKAAGKSFPPPATARAVIDTGASITSISPRIATSLGLVPTGKTTVKSATTGSAPQPCNLYDVALAFLQPGIHTHVFGVTIPVIELDLAAANYEALLGRDLLRQCLCVYDGKRGELILAI
jgi:hypothetical protein